MNILIVEDETPAARRLERLVAAHLGKQLTSIVSVETVAAARAALGGVDLVMLDLDLDGADGFDVIKGRAGDVRAGGPRVIVVSARADRAIDAFDYSVIDFVTKPVAEDRLARALDKALEPGRSDQGMSLAVRSAGRIDLARVADIVSLSGADDYVEVALTDGRRLLHDASLDELEKRLPQSFIRAHRSHIVNAKHVKSARTLGAGRRILTMSDGDEIPVSRRRGEDVVKALGLK